MAGSREAGRSAQSSIERLHYLTMLWLLKSQLCRSSVAAHRTQRCWWKVWAGWGWGGKTTHRVTGHTEKLFLASTRHLEAAVNVEIC